MLIFVVFGVKELSTAGMRNGRQDAIHAAEGRRRRALDERDGGILGAVEFGYKNSKKDGCTRRSVVAILKELKWSPVDFIQRSVCGLVLIDKLVLIASELAPRTFSCNRVADSHGARFVFSVRKDNRSQLLSLMLEGGLGKNDQKRVSWPSQHYCA